VSESLEVWLDADFLPQRVSVGRQTADPL